MLSTFDPDDYPITFDLAGTKVEVLDKCPVPPTPESKMYLLVRRDLPWPVRCVQAAHAAMALMHYKGLGTGWGARDCGPAIVLLGVDDELDLFHWLQALGSSARGFREPDLFDTLTAVAYFGQAVPEFNDLRLI